MKTLCVVLPAFNEAAVINQVLTDIQQELASLSGWRSRVVVVDDGSTDKTGEQAVMAGAVVLRHVLNRGLGGALSTGMTYAKKMGAQTMITMDSDGQHDAKDIKKLLEPLVRNKADVVIGSRMLGQKGMPWDRRLINGVSNWVTFLLFQVWTTDSQSGFRAFNRKALQTITIKTKEMEVSSELFAEMKRNRLRLKEVPIQVIYTDYSRYKGQGNLNGLRILLKLIIRLFR
jgi:glycosyltransferase involved in cell wall biosynthesis